MQTLPYQQHLTYVQSWYIFPRIRGQKETDLSFSIPWVRGPSRYGLIEGCDFDLKLVFKITFRHIFNFGMKLGLVLTCGLKCGLSEKTTVEVVVRVHPPGAKKLFVTGTGRTLDLSIP